VRQRAGLASGHLQKSRGVERARERVKRAKAKESKGAKEQEQESRFWYTQDSLQGRTLVAWLKKSLTRKGGNEFTHCR
jgi:hypothetical protein